MYSSTLHWKALNLLQKIFLGLVSRDLGQTRARGAPDALKTLDTCEDVNMLAASFRAA